MDFIHRAFGGGAHTAPHETLAALEQKYRPVLERAARLELKIVTLRLEGERVVLEATAPSPEAKEALLQELELLDPNGEEFQAHIAVAAAPTTGTR